MFINAAKVHLHSAPFASYKDLTLCAPIQNPPLSVTGSLNKGRSARNTTSDADSPCQHSVEELCKFLETKWLETREWKVTEVRL